MAKIDLKALKTRLDLVGVLQARGIQLKRQGAQYMARCPFHADRTPSLSVSPAKQLWHCFGCGAGGDVFAFLQKFEGLSFGELLRRLGVRR